MPTADLLDSRNRPLALRVRKWGRVQTPVFGKVFNERYALQVTRVKRVALAEIAGLVAAAKPADALFGSAVRK
jgi:hypothetical protein